MAPSRACIRPIARSRHLQVSTSPWSCQSQETVRAILPPRLSFTHPRAATITTSSRLSDAESIPPKPLPNENPPTRSAHTTLMELASTLKASSLDPRRRPGFSHTSKNRSSSSSTNLLSAMTQTDHAHVAAMMRVAPRQKWSRGQAYAPHDLSSVEASKSQKANRLRSVVSQPLAPTRAEFKDGSGRRRMDSFDTLKINPIDEYKNVSILQEFVSQTGRIRHPRETGLRGVNQRKIAKAVRRAVGMGLLGSVHRHPEVLEAEKRADLERVGGYRERSTKRAQDRRRGRGF